MTEIGDLSGESRRGRGGRPTQAEAERRHDLLLRTAAELFIAHGLQGASLDAIARAAGVAKRSIYARYADKGELFVAAIERLMEDRIGSLAAYEVGDAPVEEGLLGFARLLLDIALKPQTMALVRMLINEGPRFPQLARLDAERNRHKGLAAITRVLKIYADRGEIVVEDPDMLAEIFGVLTVRSAQHRAFILGPEDPAQLERRLKGSIRIFLNGCRARRA
ncbi:MAG TPA: TetR/AcrR family transcriptional regulator [Methylovirgula sp.]|nr:TetR/AcrR family transcriptional regulator [Methylovirgula sp.]